MTLLFVFSIGSVGGPLSQNTNEDLLHAKGILTSVPSVAQPSQSIPVNITSKNYTPVRSVPSSLYGLNINAYKPFTSEDAAVIEATPVTFLRFPGGSFAELYNYSTNVRMDNGTPQQNSINNFVKECESIRCHAILQLPAEIDSPSTAAYYVSYVEKNLDFTPAYWEVGDEPASWTHFGCPWTTWSACFGTNVTPGQFASILAAYIPAIRAVDPDTPIMAPGGTGQGSTHNYPWIYDEIEAVGANLAAVSIHSYANGLTQCSTNACFYSGLFGENATSKMVVQAQQAILAACATCAATKVFITESGENAELVNAAYEESFDGAVWASSELQMAMTSGAANFDWFAYDNGYPGSWELSKGGEWDPVYYVYADILPLIGNVVMNTTIVGDNGGFFALQTYSTSRDSNSLWLVNPSNSNLSVSLVDSGFPAQGGGSAYLWTNANDEPVESNWSSMNSMDIPANSIGVLVGSPPSSVVPEPIAGSPLPSGLSLYLVELLSVAAGLVLAIVGLGYVVARRPRRPSAANEEVDETVYEDSREPYYEAAPSPSSPGGASQPPRGYG